MMSTGVLHALDRDDWWVPPMGSPLDMQLDEEIEAVLDEADEAGTAPHFLYRYFDRHTRLLYVGITAELRGRRTAHRSSSEFFPYVRFATSFVYPSERAAAAAERVAIETEYPIFNVAKRNKDIGQALYVQYMACSANQWIANEGRVTAVGAK